MFSPHDRVGLMMDIMDDARRRAFSVWLRTGRMPDLHGPVEVKFNPWHDPQDGRFTFAGRGQFFAGGGRRRDPIEARTGTGIVERDENRPSGGSAPRRREKPATPAQARTAARPGSWSGGGFTGGGGGSFGGAGASATLARPKEARRSPAPRGGAGSAVILKPRGPVPVRQRPPAKAPTPLPAAEQRHDIVRNGYTFQIDGRGRTRHVSGSLTLASASVRSRTVQARAGGAERRRTDDGGHYIAARFNGPAEAFNHFAQDSAVNRGKYRAIEDQWARDKRTGKSVKVRIAPNYERSSVRPSVVDVWWETDGVRYSQKVSNDGK